MKEYVKCSTKNCESKIESSKVTLNEDGKWICPNCESQNPSIGIRILDFIKNRITVSQTEDEDRSKFIFRELVQNADDAGASIIVARFQEDALYVANDGRAFTTGPKGDFHKMSQILGQWKRDEKESAGNFGSGFQTVYAITNSPEVHSNGHSRRTNPVNQKWEFAQTTEDFKESTSPYVENESAHRGVLFRFVWRTDDEAKQEFAGFAGTPFEDQVDWPRWPNDRKRVFYDDLKSYVHDVILCCKSIRTIRIMWAIDNPKSEAYQVTRNFTMGNKPTFKQVIVEEGCGQTSPDFIGSFQADAWCWQKGKTTYEYVLVSGKICDTDGKEYHMYKIRSPSGVQIEVATKRRTIVPDKCIELKLNDIHLLFPLFDFESRFPDAPRERNKTYLYSVIPLPKRGVNKFVFSAHLFPTENRHDVDVDGNFGENRKWYRLSMKSIVNLYLESIPRVLNIIIKSEISDADKQKIILNFLPGAPSQEWMRPGREIEEEWSELNRTLVYSILQFKTIHHNAKWYSLAETHVPKSNLESSIIRILGGIPLSSEVLKHSNYSSYINKLMVARNFDDTKFLLLWNRRFDQFHELVYEENPAENGFGLHDLKLLIEYCLDQSSPKSLHALPIVPGKDGILRVKDDYRILPKEFPSEIKTIIPDSELIHEDVQPLISDIREATPTEIIEFISQAYENQERKTLDDQFLISVSASLVQLVKTGFDLRHASQKYILPYRLADKTYLGKPNKEKKTRREEYQRNWIFGYQPEEVEGLSKRVKNKIKFLSLDGPGITENEIGDIEDHFGIYRLKEEGTRAPTLFIRNFISPIGGSLFDDEVLSEFLGITSKDVLIEEKLKLQEVLPIYFTSDKTEDGVRPKDMANVPCLYNTKREWLSPSKFVINITPELEFYGYNSIHQELLNQWDIQVFSALGVPKEPQIESIINKIESIAKDTAIDENRRKNLLMDVLLDCMIHDRESPDFKEHLRNLQWIPVKNGFSFPSEAIWPTSENEQVLGLSFEGFIDVESATASLLEKYHNLEENVQKESIENLNNYSIPEKPSINQMIRAVQHCQDKGMDPPPKLFDELGLRTKPKELVSYDLGYYYKGVWHKAHDFVIRDSTARKEFDFIIEVSNHIDYLRAIGVSEYVLPKSILKHALTNKEMISRSLWDQLSARKYDIPREVILEFKDEALYPIEDTFVAPSRLIVLEMQRTGSWELRDGHFIVDKNTVVNHVEVLGEFDTSFEDTLPDRDIIRILSECCAGSKANRVTLFQSDVIYRLIELASERGLEIADLHIPIETEDGEIELHPADECFFNDDYRSELFKGQLPVVSQHIPQSCNEFLQAHGVKSLNEAIVDQQGGFSISKGMDYGPQTRRMNQLGLGLIGEYRTKEAEEAFGWLKSLRVVKVPSLEIEYSVDFLGISIRIKSPKQAHLGTTSETSNENVLFVAYPATNALYEDLANIIISKSEQQYQYDDFEDCFPKLGNALLHMLRTNPIEWGKVVQNYRTTDPYIEPFEIMEIDDLGYRKGYYDTKQKLQSWYKGCQICGMQTPRYYDLNPEVQETVSSIVSRVGGLARGNPGDYDTGNSLYLCPRHQSLMTRGLIRIPELESIFKFSDSLDKEKNRLLSILPLLEEKQKQKLEKFEDLQCSVFESKDSMDFKYHQHHIRFSKQHYLALVIWIHNYLQRRLKEDYQL